MKKDLTTSAIDRQNILNNPVALDTIQKQLGITGMLYDNEYRFTTAQIADYFEVSTKTIKRQVDSFNDELTANGYTVLKGQKLKEFKSLFSHLLYNDIDDDASQRDIDVPLSIEDTDNKDVTNDKTINTNKKALSRLKALAVFNFRALLNIGMLLTESEKAKAIRSRMLDIVIDSLNQKLGGTTKYINQRDEEFLVAITREPEYRKEFTSALGRYLNMGNEKYKYFTDEIYKLIFHENASEYRTILKLEANENARSTMYAEVLKLIASFEIGIADELKDKYSDLGRQLEPSELKELIINFASKRHWRPLLEDARVKMASRDYGLRDVIHERLTPYIKSLTSDDFQKFVGENSQDLIERVLENPALLEVFKRLKDR
ncbi:MAG: DNA-binding protein [Cytophagaceae bacterium]|nr:DNA-binding protein [Cytophagaceae bacterium]MBK9509972.1 DNA-binding protein [Cytophagaceae bacterium]MBK9933611.1 DNA-binding protein [Cytophagaceae bacterium]MBL0302676.1 DNA-binding protein [Cytophagaceae bacterium]MBL0325500.1 DNA-binding protein [Cytophagaceae bacterium]